MSKFIQLSKETRKSLGIALDKEITEQELETICKDLNEKSKNDKTMSFDINENDIPIISKYLDSLDIDVVVNHNVVVFNKDFINTVNTSKAFKRLINKTPVCISLKRIREIDKQIHAKRKIFRITMTQDDYSSFTQEEYNYFNSKYKVKDWRLRFYDLKTLKNNENVHIPNLKVYYMNCYAPEKSLDNVLTDIKDKINELTYGIKPNDRELDKFSTIYKRICENISYDYDACKQNAKVSNKEVIFQKDKIRSNNSQNLQGLLSKTTVCAGFSRILQCALNNVGLDCKWIEGKACDKDGNELGNHAWNQVKIDGSWYNTDLTWDRDDIIGGNAPTNYCLKSDKDFVLHKADPKQDIAKCDETYPVEKIYEKFYLKYLNGDIDITEPLVASSELSALSQVGSTTQNTKSNLEIAKVETNAITKLGNSIKCKVMNLLQRMKNLIGYNFSKNKQNTINTNKTNNNCKDENKQKAKTETSPWSLDNWDRREADKKTLESNNNKQNNEIDSQEIER